MTKTARVGLPLLSAGQSQKEITHNEALVLIDSFTHACCEGPTINEPPSAPEIGVSYICGDDPSGDWVDHAACLACWTEAGWRFVGPFEGLKVKDRIRGGDWQYLAGEWRYGILFASEVQVDGLRVLGPRQPPIADVAGGPVVDAAARAAVAQILSALRAHGLVASAG